MEKFLQIPTSDGHLIYGTLNWHEERRNKLIIFAHGLSGNQHEHQYFNAVRFFTPKGYDTFRFDFYGKEKNARQLSECSISIHAQDLNAVLSHFKGYGEIFLVGHSLGCLVIMNADVTSVKKIVYWDPSKGMKSLEQKNATYDESTALYTLHWGIEMAVNEEMVREWMEASDVEAYSKRITGDCSFVFAGAYGLCEGWKPHLGKLPFAVVEGATHRFVEEGTLQVLFEETLRFLER